MLHILWDASALVKRFYREIGNDIVDALFSVPASHGVITVLGFAETHAILIRKRNGGFLSAMNYQEAVSAFRREVGSDPTFRILDVPYDAIMGGISLVARHNLNASDAAILTTFLRYAGAQTDACVLVASDHRLLRAARQEGLRVLNPESVAAAEVPALLRSLA